MENKRKIGNIAEDNAVQFLIEKGYTIKEKNYQKRYGEIDIIAQNKTYIHFIEVKYRKSIKNGYPREAVNIIKQKKIKKTALCYIEENNVTNMDFSFDIIEIIDKEINYIENAFY